MNQIDIEGIRARADKATPGPWEYDDDGLQVFVSLTQTYIADVWSNDTPFIAHARQDIPALLDAYTEQAAEIARLEGLVDMLLDNLTLLPATVSRDVIVGARRRVWLLCTRRLLA